MDLRGLRAHPAQELGVDPGLRRRRHRRRCRPDAGDDQGLRGDRPDASRRLRTQASDPQRHGNHGNPYAQALRAISDEPRPTARWRHDGPVAQLKDNSTVELTDGRPRQSNISADAPQNKVLINLHVTDHDPNAAAHLANAVAGQFDKIVAGHRTDRRARQAGRQAHGDRTRRPCRHADQAEQAAQHRARFRLGLLHRRRRRRLARHPGQHGQGPARLRGARRSACSRMSPFDKRAAAIADRIPRRSAQRAVGGLPPAAHQPAVRRRRQPAAHHRGHQRASPARASRRPPSTSPPRSRRPARASASSRPTCAGRPGEVARPRRRRRIHHGR